MYKTITAEQARQMTIPMSAEDREFKLIFDRIEAAAKNGQKETVIVTTHYYVESLKVYIDKLAELGYETNTYFNATYTQTLSIRW